MDYSAIATRVKGLLTTYGTTMVLSRYSPGTFNPITGRYASSSTLTCNVIGIIKSPFRHNMGDRFLDGSLILEGDRELIIATSSTYTPGLGDTITAASVDYSVVGLHTIEPSGMDIVYRCLVRR